MSRFEDSRWADSQFSQEYRDESERYLPFRHQVMEIAISFFQHFSSPNGLRQVLDLGCGDGLFVQELLKLGNQIKVVLVDGSQEMLDAARIRLQPFAPLHFVRASFQELLADDPLTEKFDFIYSSLAIHHIPWPEKVALYRYIYDHLLLGGHFVHFDVVLAPADGLEKWYLSLWTRWIAQHAHRDEYQKLRQITERYKGNPDNNPDTLASQMEALAEIGFQQVDCYFKYGIFSLFGGKK